MSNKATNSAIRFQNIGIVGKPQNPQAAETIQTLHDHLLTLGCKLWVQQSLADDIQSTDATFLPRQELGKQVDLIVVVGGDGSMLNAGRTQIQHQVPMVGINRGHLGFLTDVRPTEVVERINEVLQGQYTEERRFILNAEVIRDGNVIGDSAAVNEVVIHPGEISKMLEFELFIDDQFVYSQRSDGLIISTPTGSTAYALSGGGPIISPKVDAMVLVPMFPHTLSSRPIVIDANSVVELVIAQDSRHSPMVSCDGQENMNLAPSDRIRINKHPLPMRILHPSNHDYYEVLRTKLGWGSKL
ncbi:NAD(+) kinase [Pleionea litopenaei]|uniref:NAD kinase n=1 Tax=Pleionea litopenaei TaxID=3070815 RepID=A0AA51RRN3_9GAMM|nr:NAD(+) kinase [Pleionea sp. HL-JVS1]WMS86341.1 NAD(+) kinase [Pleionea sp. HL-JVS1]